MDMALLTRILTPIKNKLYLLIGRAVLKAVKASEGTMLVQVSGLKDETLTDMEFLQNYGFTCYPKVGSAETVNLFINGSRDNGVTIVVHDREYRPKDLAEGDVCVYDLNENTIRLTSAGMKLECKNGNVVEMTTDGMTLECKNGNKIEATTSGIKLECKNSNTVEMVAGKVQINSANLEVLQ